MVEPTDTTSEAQQLIPGELDRRLYDYLDELGREKLSDSFYMRDFLYSEISSASKIPNYPVNRDAALANGRVLCRELLEPLQHAFGRIHIRSAYRSPSVNHPKSGSYPAAVSWADGSQGGSGRVILATT